MKRREFLQDLIQAGGLVVAGRLAAPSVLTSVATAATTIPAKKKYLITAHTEKDPKDFIDSEKRISKPVEGEIRLTSMADYSIRSIAVPMFCHGFTQNPVQENLVVGVEKWGNRGAVVDLKTGKAIELLTAPDNFRYFGHASFDHSGEKLYISASRYETDICEILVYETKHWSYQHAIELGRVAAHDICMRDDGKTFLVATRFHDPSGNTHLDRGGELVEINVSDDKIVSRYKVPYADHIMRMSPDVYVVRSSISRPHANAYVLDLKKDRIVLDLANSENYEKTLNGETLSSAKLDDEHIVVTLPNSELFFVWNLKKNQLVKQKTEGWANGVIATDGYFLVTSGTRGDLTKYNFVDDKTIAPDQIFNHKKIKIGNGRHVYLFHA